MPNTRYQSFYIDLKIWSFGLLIGIIESKDTLPRGSDPLKLIFELSGYQLMVLALSEDAKNMLNCVLYGN